MENTPAQNNKSHIATEEAEWRKILSSGDEKIGMILLHSQKLCAVAHEIEAAIKNNQISKTNTTYFAKRLAGRVNSVLQLMISEKENYKVKSSFAELSKALEALEDTDESYETIKNLILKIHSLTHQLSDELAQTTKT